MAARGTPIRSFRRDEGRWNEMVERAALEGRSTSELVNAAIDAYMLTPIVRAQIKAALDESTAVLSEAGRQVILERGGDPDAPLEVVTA